MFEYGIQENNGDGWRWLPHYKKNNFKFYDSLKVTQKVVEFCYKRGPSGLKYRIVRRALSEWEVTNDR